MHQQRCLLLLLAALRALTGVFALAQQALYVVPPTENLKEFLANRTDVATTILLSSNVHTSAAFCGISLFGNATRVTLRGESGDQGRTEISCSNSDFHFNVTGGATLYVEGVVLAFGRSESGGCARVVGAGSALSFVGSELVGCNAIADGGGLLVDRGASLLMKHSRVHQTGVGGGGGFVRAVGSRVSIENCVISQIRGGHGGAIYASDGARIQVSDSIVSDITATSWGGFVHAESSDVHIYNTSLSHCSAENGGGVHIGGGGSLLLEQTRVLNSTSTLYGGFLRGLDVNVTITDSSFSSCQASSGGAFYLERADTLLQGVAVTQSTDRKSSGNGVYFRGGNMVIEDSSITAAPPAATLEILRIKTQYIPGLDTLDLDVRLVDWLGQELQGADLQEHVIAVWACSPHTTCSLLSNHVWSTVFLFRNEAVIRALEYGTMVTCPLGESAMDLYVAAIGSGTSDVLTTPIRVECLPCAPGHSRSDNDVFWECVRCPADHYVVDPQTDACQDCRHALCSDGTCAFSNLSAPQSVWEASPGLCEEVLGEWKAEQGAWVLQACPAGFHFSADMLHCQQCLSREYIIPDRTGCRLCPAGAQCNGSGIVVGKEAGSVWSVDYTILRYRLEECPAGYVLVRDESATTQDECVKCPLGKYSFVRAVYSEGIMVSPTASTATELCTECRYWQRCEGASVMPFEIQISFIPSAPSDLNGAGASLSFEDGEIASSEDEGVGVSNSWGRRVSEFPAPEMWRRDGESLFPKEQKCEEKMSICGKTEQGSPAVFVIRDSKNRNDLNLRYTVWSGSIIEAGKAVKFENNGTIFWELRVGTSEAGQHVLEVFFKDELLPVCPFLLEVAYRNCSPASNRIANKQGDCRCREGFLDVLGSCMQNSAFVALVLVPSIWFVALFWAVLTWVKGKQMDKHWIIPPSEVIFEADPEILGRGTFGKVLKAQFRMTTVAVKRVLPLEHLMEEMGDGSVASSADLSNSMAQLERPSESFLTQSMGGRRISASPPRTASLPGSLLSMGHRTTEATGAFGTPRIRPCSQSYEVGPQQPASEACESSPGHSRVRIFPRSGSGEYTLGSAKTGSPGPVLCVKSIRITTGAESPETKPTNQFKMDEMHLVPWGMRWLSHHFPSLGLRLVKRKLNRDLIHEMRVLYRLRHPCVVTVMGAVVKGRTLMVMELMHLGSLCDILHNETMPLEGDLLHPVLADVVGGMCFLHSCNPQVVHGDLKSANVLLDKSLRAKVADFGLSQKQQLGIAIGTPFWMSPELLKGEAPTTKSDVYAFGILLYEVFSRKFPYQGCEMQEVLDQVIDIDRAQAYRPGTPLGCPDNVALIMQGCWKPLPAARPSFESIEWGLKSIDLSWWESSAVSRLREAGLRSQAVLHDVFPRHVAEALVAGRTVQPEAHENVSVFFSDLVGFTEISSLLPPHKVASMLESLFGHFDQLCTRHGVWKLETIGDAYICATNLAEKQEHDHAARMARFALDAVDATSKMLIDPDDISKGTVKIRCGIHSGPLTSTIVGTKHPKWTILGDTVNTASRMESTSRIMHIQCSERTAHLIKLQDPTIYLELRGEIVIKGKGKTTTYFIKKESERDAAGVGNDVCVSPLPVREPPSTSWEQVAQGPSDPGSNRTSPRFRRMSSPKLKALSAKVMDGMSSLRPRLHMPLQLTAKTIFQSSPAANLRSSLGGSADVRSFYSATSGGLPHSETGAHDGSSSLPAAVSPLRTSEVSQDSAVLSQHAQSDKDVKGVSGWREENMPDNRAEDPAQDGGRELGQTVGGTASGTGGHVVSV